MITMVVVSREEFFEARVRLLKVMDKAVREAIQTEEIFEVWLIYGIPDGANDADLRELAEDDDMWLECVNTFTKIMK